MPTPKVLFVNHTSQISGAEFVLMDVVRRWPDASAFLFENGPLNEALQSVGVKVVMSKWGQGLTGIRRDSPIWRAFPLAGRLCAIACELARTARRYDVVYANSQKAFVLAAVASFIWRRPLVWHLHDIIDKAHFGSLQRFLQITLANHCAAKVLVPSEAGAIAFVAEGGRRDLISVVPNGIDVSPIVESRSQIRKDLGLPDGPLAGVFSRLAPWKGQHIVIRALEKLPGVHCIVAGAALFGEHAYASSLKELADRIGVSDRVHFLGHRSDVTRLMQAVDVMVHPSIDPEPFGRTLVEAMFVKVPVIATNTGAAFDILEGGAAGTLITPDDADELAAAMAHVLSKPAEVQYQIEFAATCAQRKYNVGKMRDTIAQLIGNIVTEVYA